jgi:aldose 1-epimerase
MEEIFGHGLINEKVYLFTLKNKNGLEIKISNYGGIVHSFLVPDKDGHFEDILLGFDDFKGYLSPENPYFGCLVGRVANRISNSKFVLDGKEYKLAKNEGENHLHGGVKSFDKVIWDVNEISDNEETGIELSYLSPDGEEGYPGNLQVKVTYILSDNNEFKIKYLAETDKDTPVNLTHHAYFNLCGNAKRNVLDHAILINASSYTEIDNNSLPTGHNLGVEGTPFDFRKMKAIGRDILSISNGYDHNFVIDGKGLKKAAEVIESQSKRKMEVFTTSLGVQFYTGNYLNPAVIGKNGKAYQKHDGFCLETQYFPDAINIPNFPSCLLIPKSKFEEETIYKFSTID